LLDLVLTGTFLFADPVFLTIGLVGETIKRSPMALKGIE
jgi:hypothetical protein